MRNAEDGMVSWPWSWSWFMVPGNTKNRYLAGVKPVRMQLRLGPRMRQRAHPPPPPPRPPTTDRGAGGQVAGRREGWLAIVATIGQPVVCAVDSLPPLQRVADGGLFPLPVC